MRRRLVVWGFILIALIAVGAVLVQRTLALRERLPAVPEELTMKAEIPGMPHVRYWVAVDIEPFVRDVVAAREREQAYLAQAGHAGELPPGDLLAVSGGGDNGAFGAGLLNGWTAAGDRPVFKAVTGVSTGALIAPFAFLGPDYDYVLREVYTSVKPTDIAQRRSVLAAINDDGMADNRPLWSLISKYVTDEFLAKIAEQHRRGRILLIGTTDLDARQPVIWNMGLIASSGAPHALDLFRSILLASAAIPGAFPPTMIRVEADGVQYEEMHVDGGASAQVFLYPPSTRGVAQSMGVELKRQLRVFIIRNSKPAPTGSPVERRTINIAGPAIASLIHTQGIGDLYRIYVTSQKDGLDFNLAYIGSDFTFKDKKEDFDTAYMVSLFDYGYKLAEKGYPWKKVPPGLDGQIGR